MMAPHPNAGPTAPSTRTAVLPAPLLPALLLRALILPAVLLSGLAACGSDQRSAAEQPTAATTAAAPSSAGAAARARPGLPGIGTPVRSGDVQFRVTEVRCGVSQVGDETLRATASGQFCLVAVSAKNLGKKAETVVTSAQKLVDKSGRQFSTDKDAEISIRNWDWLVDDIEPGDTTKGQLVFDLPKTAQPAELQLLGGLLDTSARVSLRS